MVSCLKLKVLLICLALLIFATPALAGGWATVTLHQMPGEIRAGETVDLSFVVLQHGETPIHYVAHLDNAPMEPYLTARNVDTDETLRVAAERGKEVGRFTLEVVFPSEGKWEWKIAPDPLVGVTEFEPLTVLPAVQKAKADTPTRNTVPAPSNTIVGQWTFQVAGTILIAVALAAFTVIIFAQRRRTAAHKINN